MTHDPLPITQVIRQERGMVLFLTFLMMLVLTGLAIAVGVFSHNSVVGGRNQLQDKQAFYIAEAGWQRARQALVAGSWSASASPGNTYTESFGAGEYAVTVVDNGGGSDTITSAGYVPNQTATAAKRQIVESDLSVTSSSGANLALTATASASSSGDSHPASDAKDGSTSTYWGAGVNGNGWLAMDHGSAISLNQIVVKEKNFITAVRIEWSDDDSSWTAASGLSVDQSGKTWTATFTAASHRYFRAAVSANSNRTPSVEEMEDYNTTISSLGAGDVTTQW